MAMIAKQPNGLYCRYSNVVETITHYNMTKEEYIQIKMEEAKKNAEEVLKDYLHPYEMIKERITTFNETEKSINELIKRMER